MDLLPAIDLRRGQVVRLRQGDDKEATRYSTDPLAVLAQFAAAGARRVHVVDLDAAFGEPPQRALLEKLAASTTVRLQLGGGLRGRGAVEWALDAGFDRLVVGSWLIRDPRGFFATPQAWMSRVVAALEFRQDELRISGWQETAGRPSVELLAALRGAPLAAALVTDVERDGALGGPNFELCARVADATGLPVLGSGGVRSLHDVRQARRLGLAGLVVGTAVYEGAFSLADALRAAAGLETP